jgi:alpha-amylase/alpha-mannosidase (GH57 family)
VTVAHHRGERRHLVIHAHFYQPPREDPAFDEVEAEPSAAPDHDWNQRIERECYRAVVAARVHGADGRIAGIVNTLEWISFNVGPTLFEWMARHAPDTVRRIVEADRASVQRLGHGNAIAQPYHHVILPLASRRDKVTEVRWGILDFRRRFGRDPGGMWLPETAVDDETLDVLAQEGMRFTVLAPHQVVGVPANGHPGRYVTANGREIALFPYHGDISHGIAFGGLVRNADSWLDAIWGVKAARRRTPAASEAIGNELPHPLLVSAATDGETYGHHHKFAELALARVLERSRLKGGHIDNFASFLAQHPPRHDVGVVDPSSWSCSHGVERWCSDCGCRMDGGAAPSQAWRGPLREGMNTLGASLATRFEDEGARWFRTDPWQVRDEYGEIVGMTDVTRRSAWLEARVRDDPPDPAQAHTRPLQLLEMTRDAMRMFTSCAWFFDDIGGIEPRQVLRYAARAIELSGRRSELEPILVDTLATAGSNDPGIGSGDRVYQGIRAGAPATARYAAAIAALDSLGLLSTNQMFGSRGDAGSLSAFDATVDGSLVRVIDGRLLQQDAYRVIVGPLTAGDIVCEVTALAPDGDGTAATFGIALAAFPERIRLRIRQGLRDTLIARCLTAGDREELEAGRSTLRELAAGSLHRAVLRLEASGFADSARAELESNLDLFQQLETHVPFDVQTAFWDAWSRHSAPRSPSLRDVARRLGFTGE